MGFGLAKGQQPGRGDTPELDFPGPISFPPPRPAVLVISRRPQWTHGTPPSKCNCKHIPRDAWQSVVRAVLPHPCSNTTETNSRLERSYTSTYSNTFTFTSYDLTDTSAKAPQGTSLRRPQRLPRSPKLSERHYYGMDKVARRLSTNRRKYHLLIQRHFS